jgi:plasmid stability protein
MAQFIVRHLEDDVKSRLKRRAERHGRSMEEEVRHILRNALKEENRPAFKLGSRIAARFARTGLATDLPELHGQLPRSADFGR